MELYYSKLGDGPALIILHGLYGQGNNWMNIAREFSDSFTVYLVDMRNHGQSEHSPTHTYDVLAKDVKEFCDRLKIDRCYLLGHSMGGKTAITFTLQYPGIVQKLIVVDISPYSYLGQSSFEQQISFHKQVIETFKNTPFDTAKSRTDIENYFKKTIETDAIRMFLLKNLKRTKEGKFYWQLNVDALSKNLEGTMDTAPPVKFGARSSIPTLFLRGGKSPYLTNEDISAIPDVFPNAEFITFENAGHWLHAEKTERFVEKIRNFLGVTSIKMSLD